MGKVTWLRIHGNDETEALDHRNYTDRMEQPLLLENLVHQGVDSGRNLPLKGLLALGSRSLESSATFIHSPIP